LIEQGGRTSQKKSWRPGEKSYKKRRCNTTQKRFGNFQQLANKTKKPKICWKGGWTRAVIKKTKKQMNGQGNLQKSRFPYRRKKKPDSAKKQKGTKGWVRQKKKIFFGGDRKKTKRRGRAQLKPETRKQKTNKDPALKKEKKKQQHQGRNAERN